MHSDSHSWLENFDVVVGIPVLGIRLVLGRRGLLVTLVVTALEGSKERDQIPAYSDALLPLYSSSSSPTKHPY